MVRFLLAGESIVVVFWGVGSSLLMGMPLWLMAWAGILMRLLAGLVYRVAVICVFQDGFWILLKLVIGVLFLLLY
jgi:hypothetical protein